MKFRYKIMALWVLLSLFISPLTACADELPALQELGLSLAVSSDARHQSRVEEYRDARTGRVLRLTYSAAGGLELTEVLGSAGQLLERTTSRYGLQETEVFWPRHQIARHTPHGSLHIGVERLIFSDGATSIFETEISRAESFSCDGPTAVDDVWKQANGIGGVVEKITSGVPDKSVVDLGLNLAARNCATYPGGGDAKLAEELQSTMSIGLSCLAQHNHGIEAGRLISLLRNGFQGKKVLFSCAQKNTKGDWERTRTSVVSGKCPARLSKTYTIPQTPGAPASASASFCDCDYPTIWIGPEHLPGVVRGSMDGNFTATSHRKAMLFHESLHLLGIPHADGVHSDLPYLAGACCFMDVKTSSKLRDHACQVLGDFPLLPDSKSYTTTYLPAFYNFMIEDGHATEGLDAVIHGVRTPQGPDLALYRLAADGLKNISAYSHTRFFLAHAGKVEPLAEKDTPLEKLGKRLGVLTSDLDELRKNRLGINIPDALAPLQSSINMVLTARKEYCDSRASKTEPAVKDDTYAATAMGEVLSLNADDSNHLDWTATSLNSQSLNAKNEIRAKLGLLSLTLKNGKFCD